MAMTPEMLSMIDALGKTIASAIEKANTNIAQGRHSHGRRLDERMYRRVDKFDGSTPWSDFAFMMKSATRSATKSVVEIMEWAEKQDDDIDQKMIDDQVVDVQVDSSGSKLFDILVSLTYGEATMVIRGTQSMNEYIAWKRLVDRYNPNTPAKALSLMMEVMNPKLQSDPNRIPQALEEWDLKCMRLQKEYNDKLSDSMRTALMLSMCPGDLQDMMYQQAANLKDYPDARARLKGLIQNRIVRNDATPMDIGKIDKEKPCQEEVCDEWNDSGIYYFQGKGKGKGKGKNTCHSCG